MRTLTYTQAIREATAQAMAADPKVLLLGMGVDDHKAIHGSTAGLATEFPGRVFDTPLSEDTMQGVCNGLAMAGYRPIHVYTRFDFALLAANQIINMAAKARYMYGGRVTCPVVIRVAIGRSWGQGAQHSQGLHGMFAHIPGLRVVAPANPYHAKGLLLAALASEDPVLYVEHRLLYGSRGHVPEEIYRTPLGIVSTYGARPLEQYTPPDLIIVATSLMLREALAAQAALTQAGCFVDVVDPVTISPLDMATIVASVRRCSRVPKLLIVDAAWPSFGLAAEVAAGVAEALPGVTLARLGHALAPCPTSKPLEDLYYPNAKEIAARAWWLHTSKRGDLPAPLQAAQVDAEPFRGPF